MLKEEQIDWLREAAGMEPQETSFEFDVNGRRYIYQTEVQDDGEIYKMFHYVVDPSGKRHFLDWSPYGEPTEEDLELWVKLGMPGRVGTGPLNRHDLKELARKKL